MHFSPITASLYAKLQHRLNKLWLTGVRRITQHQICPQTQFHLSHVSPVNEGRNLDKINVLATAEFGPDKATVILFPLKI